RGRNRLPCETYFGAALAGECDSLCFPARLGQLFSSKSQPSLGKAVQHIAIVLVGPCCHVEAFLGETLILRGVEHRQNNARLGSAFLSREPNVAPMNYLR